MLWPSIVMSCIGMAGFNTLLKIIKFVLNTNPSGAATGISSENYVRSMTAEALAPYIARSSTAVVLTLHNDPCLTRGRFLLHTPCMRWEMIANANISLWNWFSITRFNEWIAHVGSKGSKHVTAHPQNLCPFLTHWGWYKMAAIFHMTLSNVLSWMKILEFRVKCHWSLFLCPINNIPTLVQIMGWCRPLTSHYYLNQWWLVYWCKYVSLGINELTTT